MEKGIVYILRSLKNDKFYIGSTTDLKRRLHQHKMGSVVATYPLRPLKLEFYQEFDTISTARTIERRLKKLKRRDYIEKIIRDKYIKMATGL